MTTKPKTSEAQRRASKKYDENNYKQITVKIPKDIYDKMIKCKSYDNNNQFANTAIVEKIENENR